MRSRHTIVAAFAAALLAPAVARGEIAWLPCPGKASFECGALDVPLDRAGAVPGSVHLSVQRTRAVSNPRNAALLPLAGGPGQAALALAGSFAKALGVGLADRDLLVFDQRGTGGSSALSCRALRTRSSQLTVSRRCAEQLGPARAFFRTPESVEDIEALRREAGYEKLAIYGISYGTKLAVAYAARFPSRVEALVLDSVVLPEGPDPFRRSSMAAVPRLMRELCAGRACVGATPNAPRELIRLSRRLESRSLRGEVIDERGRRRRASLGQTGLFHIVLSGDLNPTLRAELPGSVRAALAGDPTPILRLSVRSSGLANGAQSAQADSLALFLTTTCEEAPFPWTRGAPVSQRASEITAATRALSRSEVAPFSARVALTGGVIPLCLGWPVASPASGPPDAPPSVPTLLLDGRGDARTPLEDAALLAGRIGGAQLAPVPFTGHSVLGNDLTGCGQQALAAFFAGQPVGACAEGENPFSPTPRPPRKLGALMPIGGLAGRRGRTLAAVRATVLDARRQVIGESIAQHRRPASVGGLRSGYALVSASSGAMTFRRYSYAPGVTLSGALTADGVGRVAIRGRAAARGVLTIARNGTVTGRLGGRVVATSIASAAAHDRLPSLRAVLALPRLG